MGNFFTRRRSSNHERQTTGRKGKSEKEVKAKDNASRTSPNNHSNNTLQIKSTPEIVKKGVDKKAAQQNAGDGDRKKRGSNLVVADPPKGQPKRRLRDSYKVLGKLGEGSYGKVRKGVSLKNGEEVAIKSILKKNIKRIETLKREIRVMLRLDHPHIVKLKDVFEDNTHLHIVMEILTGGELFDSIVTKGSYSEADASELLQQILGAVAYLHENHVAHRDLKPENFLFASTEEGSDLKIIDFGLSRFYNDKSMMKTRVGTPYYIAPEVLRKQYDNACDIWSVGVIMYILLCGYPPFWGNTEKEIFQRIRRGTFDYPKEEWQHISESAKDLVGKLLEADPERRITAKKALTHEWLQDNRNEKLHPEMLRKLTSFAKLNRLKRAALGVIARMLNEKEIASLRKQFQAVDADGNGYITVLELTQALRTVGLDPSAHEVDNLIGTIDADGNGVIDYSEFIAASMEAHLYLRDEILQKAFDYFDLDKTGKITQTNLKVGLREEDPVLVDNLLNTIDRDMNGVIDFEEFKNMMRDSSVDSSAVKVT